MSHEIAKVTPACHLESVVRLARDIWNEHYVNIIGQEQVDYMLGRFQSAEAISRQLADGYDYYLVTFDGSPAGYFALSPLSSEKSVQLSKIYVISHHRGRGLGRAIMEFVERQYREIGADELWLTVNRHNAGSIAFYERCGFLHDGTIVQDIGGGFVMDDYRMSKRFSQSVMRREA